MRVCGIIAEYDPFHLGHLYHLEESRKQSQADYVICVISTAFTQRGLPGLFSTRDRAQMALEGGADLVLGMPVRWACAQANRFAAGGVGILNALGVVTHLAFGVEALAVPWLQPAADLLAQGSPAFDQAFDSALAQGQSIARAQGEALRHGLPGAEPQALRQPNFLLAVCYLQALSALKSPIQPLAVPRQSRYHATQLAPLPSATAVREAVMRGDWSGVKRSVPPASYRLIAQRLLHGGRHPPEALDKPLLARLLDGESLKDVPEISEGLDRRILAMARLAHSREHLVALTTTRRYPRTRIQRALTAILLDLRGDAPVYPPHARLLGMRRGSEPLLRRIKQAGFPLVSRPAREKAPLIIQDMRAEQLWYLGAQRPPAQAWQQKMLVL